MLFKAGSCTLSQIVLHMLAYFVIIMQSLASYVNLLWLQLEPLVEKELYTLIKPMISPSVFRCVRADQHWAFFLVIVLYLLQFWVSNYLCVVFNRFLCSLLKQTCRRDPWLVHRKYKLCWNLPLFNSVYLNMFILTRWFIPYNTLGNSYK